MLRKSRPASAGDAGPEAWRGRIRATEPAGRARRPPGPRHVGRRRTGRACSCAGRNSLEGSSVRSRRQFPARSQSDRREPHRPSGARKCKTSMRRQDRTAREIVAGALSNGRNRVYCATIWRRPVYSGSKHRPPSGSWVPRVAFIGGRHQINSPVVGPVVEDQPWTKWKQSTRFGAAIAPPVSGAARRGCGGVRTVGLRALRPGGAGRGVDPHAPADRGAVLPRPPAARHRQRPADRQRLDHAGRRRNHAPERQDPRRQGRRRCATPWSRSGSATTTASTSTPRAAAARSRTRTSRASGGSSPAPPANTTSARSSPSRTPAARRTSTSR